MAIEHINDVHPFFGITFLSAKQHQLPVGEVTTCSIDTWNKEFMNQYHGIAPESSYYFQPYNSNSRDKQWVNQRYPSTGLQAVNTQTFKEAFIHERGSRTWGWSADYIAFLHDYISSYCDEIVGWDDWVISTDDVRHNYCPKCGRAVLWDAESAADGGGQEGGEGPEG